MPDNSDQNPENKPPDSGLSEPEKTELRDVMAEGSDKIEADEGKRREELRLNMLRSVVTEPLLSKVRSNPDATYDVIISLNELYSEGMDTANQQVRELAAKWKVDVTPLSNYLFACLTGRRILELAAMTQDQIQKAGKSGKTNARAAATIYRIWEDNDVHMSLTRSLTTVKADAAQRAFQASGRGITWAVLDSGIQGDHPHFKRAKTPFGPIDSLDVASPLQHVDFTPQGRAKPETNEATAKTDRLGHGTHVAGIIAGYWESANPDGEPVIGVEERDDFTAPADGGDEDEAVTVHSRETLRSISGVAPACKLVSMKVIADVTDKAEGSRQTAKQGKVSWILQAIDRIQTWNQNGRRLLIHGVNMSVGYDFDPRWFACGESPLCVEVNRLVKSGVAVVVSAGNGGYTAFLTRSTQALERYSDLSITDPGNAELAVTVGSTHREMPHRYGVSYFSSRGPTGDGRLKPDLLAPGERIISCAAGQEQAKFSDTAGDPPLYVEQTGTSMAAPHVSGAIAAFLSVRTEFIGQPERVKETFMNSAIDLKRERTFQGAGLVDLMKALQSV